MARVVLSFLGWCGQDAELAASNRRRSVHSLNDPYKSPMGGVDNELLRTTGASPRSVPIAPLKIKHFTAGLAVFDARSFQKGEILGATIERW